MGEACEDRAGFERTEYLPSHVHGEPSARLLAPAFQQSPQRTCQSSPCAASGIVRWQHAGQCPSGQAAPAAGLT